MVGVGGRPRSQPERPTERASSKAGGRATRGCPGVPRTNCVRIRPRSSCLGDSGKGRRAQSTHRTNAGGQQDGRRRGPPGSSTPTQARYFTNRGLCRGDHHWHPPPSAHRSTAQGVLTGGAAATGHGAPRAAPESRPGVVTDRPKIFDQLAAKGGTPPARTGWNVT